MGTRQLLLLATGLVPACAAGASSACGQVPERAAVRSQVTVMTADGRSRDVIYATPRLFEAPNWSPDGTYLLLNSGGQLWRLPAAGGEPHVIPTGSIRGINN